MCHPGKSRAKASDVSSFSVLPQPLCDQTFYFTFVCYQRTSRAAVMSKAAGQVIRTIYRTGVFQHTQPTAALQHVRYVAVVRFLEL